MGLFGLFGGKKKKEEEEALLQEKLEAEKKEKALTELKEKHAGLGWPKPVRINPVKVAGSDEEVLEDPLTEERKNEIGEMVYDEELSAETIRFLSMQELLFLLTAEEGYHKVSPLPGFEANHRKIYNEILGRIRDSKTLFVLYDQLTGYPFIDHGYINIYSSEEYANEAAKVFEKQFRKIQVKPCSVNSDAESARDRKSFFDYLYYLGMEHFIVDNGYYRAHFKRNEIVAAPGDWGGKGDNSPKNPALVYAMLDFLSEARWPVKYEKRAEILKAKELRMAQTAQAATYIVPMQHEGPVEVMEDGRFKFTKDTKIRFPEIKTKNEKHFLPVFTDGIEFAKMFAKSDFRGAVFTFGDILRFVGDRDGVIINAAGEKIMIPRDRMMVIQMTAQQVNAAAQGAKKPAKKKLSETEAAIQSAMSGKGIAAKAGSDEEGSMVELEDDAPMTDIPQGDEGFELEEGTAHNAADEEFAPEE